MHRRAAFRAEAVGDPAPGVADSRVFLRAPLDRDLRFGKARVVAEGAARPPLTGEAMANGNPHRLAFADGYELAAGTFGASCFHRHLLRGYVPSVWVLSKPGG